ncbi:hypothetical protein [Nocardia sp. NPDC003963]
MSMRFEVKVSSYGDRWLLSAPAFGVRKIVEDESAIRTEAHRMIARCGTAPAVFEIDLVPGGPPPGNAGPTPVEVHGQGLFPRGASLSELRAAGRGVDESPIDDGF